MCLFIIVIIYAAQWDVFHQMCVGHLGSTLYCVGCERRAVHLNSSIMETVNRAVYCRLIDCQCKQ